MISFHANNLTGTIGSLARVWITTKVPRNKAAAPSSASACGEPQA